MLYMVIERFADPVPVYQRFRDCGRLAPPGLHYVFSWVDEPLQRCFQIMETSDPDLFDEWIKQWNDIVEFEVIPVTNSTEAMERIAPRLEERNR